MEDKVIILSLMYFKLFKQFFLEMNFMLMNTGKNRASLFSEHIFFKFQHLHICMFLSLISECLRIANKFQAPKVAIQRFSFTMIVL